MSVLVAELLGARGFDCITTRDANLLGSADEQQLLHAIGSERALVTHNRVDLERLIRRYFEDGLHHFGVMIAVRRLPNDLTLRILRTLKGKTPESLKDQVVYL